MSQIETARQTLRRCSMRDLQHMLACESQAAGFPPPTECHGDCGDEDGVQMVGCGAMPECGCAPDVCLPTPSDPVGLMFVASPVECERPFDIRFGCDCNFEDVEASMVRTKLLQQEIARREQGE